MKTSPEKCPFATIHLFVLCCLPLRVRQNHASGCCTVLKVQPLDAIACCTFKGGQK